MSATVFTIGHYNDAGTLDRKFYLPFSNLGATAAPGVSNDDTEGYVAGSKWVDTTNNKVYFCTDNATGAATWVEAGASGGIIVLQDQKTSGTDGGTFTSGAWRTRDLNTEVVDVGGHCSLSSNQFTLDAGTYEIIAFVPGVQCNSHQARLRNITDSTTTISGTSSFSLATYNGETYSIITGRFTIAASKAFEIQHICATTKATVGFGVNAGSYVAGGVANESYTTVILKKVA